MIGLTFVSISAVLILPAIINVATSGMPESWGRYTWIAWPVAIVLALLVAADMRGERRPMPAGADPALLDRAAGDLANVIEKQWLAEAAVWALNQPEPIRIPWAAAKRSLSASRSMIRTGRFTRIDGRRIPSAGSHDKIADVLLCLPNRQMVILGTPGAGKTSIAIILVLDLLGRRRNDEVPVPVLLPISSWRSDREDLLTWISRRIKEEYPGLANTNKYGADVARRLIDTGLILPILDGLDEMPPAIRASAIEGISIATGDAFPFVLTCRSEEYEQAVLGSTRVLSRAYVVEIRPVEPAAARAYLSNARLAQDDRWSPLLLELQNNPMGPLASALSTPLMVWLVRTIYSSPESCPAEMADLSRFHNRQAIEDYLLDALLPAIYAPRSIMPTGQMVRRYRTDRAIAWLTFLACHLNQEDSRDLAWWRLERAVSRIVLGVLAAAPILLVVTLAPLMFSLVSALRTADVIAISMAIVLGPATALAVSLAGPPVLPANLIGPVRGQPRWLRTLAGLVVGGISAALVGPFGGLQLAVGVVALFLVGGVLLSMLHAPDAVRVSDPMTIYRRDRAAMLSLAAICTSFGTLIGVIAGPDNIFPAWLVLSSGGAFAFGSSAYVLARSRQPIAMGPFLSTLGRHPLIGVLLHAALGGAVGGILGKMTAQSVSGAVVAIIGAVFYGVTIGFVVGLSLTATGWFILARGYLAAHGRIPWRLMVFLDDAHHRGVLRQAGGFYEFRHARLQDRLVLQQEIRFRVL
ncbi:hypothetical protein [Micromonospora sp. NPDC047527]|uniref:NACHT domain-containing protein n=1 Tax=Micromonospora sp. NPDC047527 TaxID=3155144 RepID=UPI0033C3955C